MQNAALGSHYEHRTFRRVHGILEQCGRRSHLVGNHEQRFPALRMSQHHRLRILLFQFHDLLHRKFLVDMTCAVPQKHLPPGHRIYIIAEIPVRTENNLLILRKRLHDLSGVRRSHQHVAQSLHLRRSIDIAHHRMAGMLTDETTEITGRATVGKRTSGTLVRQQHRLVRTEYLHGLTHEVHTAHHHHRLRQLRADLGQRQRIAYMVGHILNLRTRIIMGQNHRLFLLLQFFDFCFQFLYIRHVFFIF